MGNPVIDILLEALEKERFPQSLLFYGEDSKVFDEVTRPLVQKILETDRDPQNHPDYFAIYPEGKMQLIKIESIRKMIKSVQHTANQGGRKVVVIHDVDKMNQASSNAFLKTLEEPPEDTVIFLFTTRLYSLMETIRSRCLKFKITERSVEETSVEWKSWFESYENWLERVHARAKDRMEITRLVLSVYSLIARFEPLIKDISAAEWENLEKNLPKNLSEESLVALQTGTQKGTRNRFLQEIERVNQKFFRVIVEREVDVDPPVNKLARSVDCLEKMHGLMEVNFTPAAALENYFLNTLRIWSAK
jgi:DNA polymerase-3 subunit delta'